MSMLQGWQADVWTALPGIVQSYDPVAKTCTVQPTIQARVTAADGSKSWVSLPLLLDCPVYFPSGGGYTLTFPITAGDECLVVFSSRCIDAWWQSGGIDIQAATRMHDLSDGFVFAGISSTPHVQPNLSTNAVQLRNNAGTVYIEIDGTAVKVVTPGSASITAPSIALIGDVSITGALHNNGVNIGSTHVHGGVASGGSSTGGPT
jgi:hypothetical protein